MLPRTAGLAGLMLAAFAAGPDAQSLIARLGAPKYSDRQAASAELSKLGPAAFSALKAARADRDPEVQSRARLLMEEIERASVVQPTSIRFEPRCYTLAEVAEKIGEGQGIAIIAADPGAVPASRRTIEFREPAELGIWSLMDRLGMTLQHDAEADFGRSFYRKLATTRLVLGPMVRSRTSDSGPFRMTARPPYFAVDQAFETRNRAARASGVPVRDTDLIIPIDVTAEPRLTLRLETTGTVRILEAVDNHGRSLSQSARGELDPVARGDRALATLPIRIRLHPEGEAVASLTRLRGVIPLEIEARKLEPITMPIPTASQDDRRPVACGTATTVQVNGLATSPMASAGSYVVDITVRRDSWVGFGRMGGRRMAGQLWEMVNSDESFWENFEIVDAQGKPFRPGARRPVSTENDGIRIHLILPAREDNAPPTEVRFHTTIRATRDVPFDFKDISVR